MEETKVIKNKPKRKELMEQIGKLKSDLRNAEWNRDYAERQQAKVKELKAYIKGLKGENLEEEEEN